MQWFPILTVSSKVNRDSFVVHFCKSMNQNGEFEAARSIEGGSESKIAWSANWRAKEFLASQGLIRCAGVFVDSIRTDRRSRGICQLDGS